LRDKEKQKAYNKAWWQNHPHYGRDYNRNPSRIEYNKQYRIKNSEHYKKYQKEWRRWYKRYSRDYKALMGINKMSELE
jgi:hypothetical protein